MPRRFKVSKASLHTTKALAQEMAASTRRRGYRAEVHPSSQTTRSRSPSLKWTCFRGQKRLRR